MASTTSMSDDQNLSNITPRTNNCAKRRETHPKVNHQHFDTDQGAPTHHKLQDDCSDQVAHQFHLGLDESGGGTSNDSTNIGPLSWNEARNRLKSTLEFWNKRQQKSRDIQSIQTKYKFLCWENLDIILAILLCGAFVALSFILPAQEDLPELFTSTQRIAAVLFMISSLVSASILNRWAQVRERDHSIERRRCVTAFLKEMESLPLQDNLLERRDDILTDVIPRKNVEDVYSTYRLNNDSYTNKNDVIRGQWHRIPSLLLVKGDYVALKVGDTSPAKCQSVEKIKGVEVIIDAGVRLSTDSVGANPRLPPGKTTVKTDEDLLVLANGVKVFELLETPLESFLNKNVMVHQKLPQIVRQGQAVRTVLLRVAFVAFFFITAILLIRPSVGPMSFFASPNCWTIPILSALCFLPTTTPLFLFCLECIGTARILATTHPWASNQKQAKKDVEVRQKLGEATKPPRWLLIRYIRATLQSRLRSSANTISNSLLTIPPASVHLLEKLGLVTCICLVDDELACEPHSTPQQLLIPSKDGGLKILDLCPAFNEEDEYSTDEEENEQINNHSSRSSTQFRRSLDVDVVSLDSDDDDENQETRFAHSFSAPARSWKKKLRKRYNKKRSSTRPWLSGQNKSNSQHQINSGEVNENEVQFEDPAWWQFLPSLKSIGLACMLIENESQNSDKQAETSKKVVARYNLNQKVAFNIDAPNSHLNKTDAKLLVNHLCIDRERKQLGVLSRCIGFSCSPNELGREGDLSSFVERRRLHIISSDLLRNRLQLKQHAMGLEEYRNWSRLYTDADTIFVKDSRSGGDLVLTVGDARVVTTLCPDWWQGENSTISPLTASDRYIIIETQNNWMSSDLDVQAFSYAPLPYNADHKIGCGNDNEPIYLLDNSSSDANASGFWSLVKNQIFLGLLGSSVRPRKEIEPLITASSDAGVRFVYFSPRNMRRTKELASQMGIDVAWNCAISLRPLDEGEDDLYRMTSNYADWDVNAKLPHGVEDVKRHLEEVDNVPLLVSLYTDVTKKTTADMVNVFQDYHDNVLSVGLSHLPGNHEIFSRADIAIGVDVLAEDCLTHKSSVSTVNALLPAEVSFVASISAHSSVFNLLGSRSTCHLLEIIQIGRASLEAVTSSSMFFLSGLLSFGIFLMLCPCTVATVTPTIPSLEAFFYIQIILHGIGLCMANTDGNQNQMTRVPPKNDASVNYSFKQSRRFYLSLFLRSVPSSIISHVIYLVVLGELMWAFDSSFIEDHCHAGELNSERPPFAAIIRCQDLKHYYGPSTIAAGTIAFTSLALCTIVLSASFLLRTESILSEAPWSKNRHWVGSIFLSIALIAAYLAATLERGTMSALSWYFYVLFVLAPFICLFMSEIMKKADQKQEKRAAMMRRLQFETRLGMWSPKESTHIIENQGNVHVP